MKINFVDVEIEKLKVGREIKRDIKSILNTLSVYNNDTALNMMSCIVQLWTHRPLTPLTGDYDEWMEVDDMLVNKRCPAVIKRDGETFCLHKFCYCEPNSDTWFYTLDSVGVVEFPCEPEELRTEYRELFFSTKYIPLKWAIKLHLYRKVDE